MPLARWILAASLLLPCARAAAQAYSDPGLGLGLYAGWTGGVDAASGSVSVGLCGRARVTGGIGLEVMAGWRRERIEDRGSTALELDELPLQVSAQVFPVPFTRVQPYGFFGVGYTYIRARGLGSFASHGRTTENKIGIQGGVGVDVRLARRLSAQLDLRYAALDVEAVNQLGSQTGRKLSGDSVTVAAVLNLYF